jgi:hypothetical protein
MNDLTVSRRDGHVVFVSATNAYRRGIHVAGGFGTKASRRAWHVFVAQVVKLARIGRYFLINMSLIIVKIAKW